MCTGEMTTFNACDISNGAEPHPIPVLTSGTGHLDIGSDYKKYITDNQTVDGIPFSELSWRAQVDEREEDSDESLDDGIWQCDCAEHSTCIPGGDCDCVGNFGHFYHTSVDGRQALQIQSLPPNLPLVECGPDCHCPPTCPNRLTQQGVSSHLQLRQAQGLGLFSSASLPVGHFICLYAGEWIDTETARRRWKERSTTDRNLGNYILSVRENGKTLGHIDPTAIGNIGRFINHSCEPNLVLQTFRWGPYADPRIAIFTRRVVQAGEELRYDYGDAGCSTPIFSAKDAIPPPDGCTRCQCGTPSCRGFIPFDASL